MKLAFNPYRRIFFILLGILCVSESFSQLFINEIQAYNASSYLEKWWGNFPDWIELYNGGKSPVDLAGYYITDDINVPAKWEIHSGIIYPGGFELLYADKVGYRMHTNFSLDGDGEQILLFTPELVLMDSMSFGEQYPDISYGRYPDGSQDWNFFEKNTPGESNSAQHMSQPAFSDRVQFSPEGGFYAGSQIVSLSTGSPSAEIRYTMDGSDPDAESAIYTEPFTLSSTSVIRAKVFEPGVFSGETSTHTYIFDKEITLPVISISVNREYLWDDQVGIYVVGTNGITSPCSETPANYYQDWERPINVEYFDQHGNQGFNQMAGTKIFGACSRRANSKSMALFARGKYGKKEFDYKLFKDKDIDKFKSFIIRNSGNDNRHTKLRDGMMQNLVKDRMDVDYQEYQPAIIYLNGDYWGILNIREKINEDYLEANHGVDADSVDMLSGHVQVVEGEDTHYQQMMDFVRSNDVTDPETYSYLNLQMDMNQFLNYQIAQIYYFNQDWPQGNIKYWRPQSKEGRWRWLLYDLDFGFDFAQYTDNMVEWATRESQISTELFRELLTNSEFRSEFLQRFCSHMNTTFQPERVIGIIDSLTGDIEAELPYHIEKFLWPRSMTDWYDDLRILKDFAENRLPVLTGHLQEHFELKGSIELSTRVSDSNQGRIQICGVDVPAQYSGPYFGNLPLTIKAIPAEGWTFLGWQGASNSIESEIEMMLSRDTSITALFGPAEPLIHLKINELSSLAVNGILDEHGEQVDWIEFYNSGTEAVNMAGLYLSDSLGDLSKFKIPTSGEASTMLYPDSSLVFYADNDPDEGSLHLGFKLSNKGETILLSQLIDNELIILDSLAFTGQFAGSTAGRIPDGTGSWQMTQPTPGNSNEAMPTISGLFINEFSASNQTIIDIHGEYKDWIEIFNSTDEPVDLGGLYLTDSLPDKTKYRIPTGMPDSTTIPSNGYLILWADNQPEQGVLHLGFGLKRKGEQLGLIGLDGFHVIDSLGYGEQYSNSSISRYPDGSEGWYALPPTPGEANENEGISGIRINEFSASNELIAGDNYGEYEDWIELYNYSDQAIDIGGLFLTDSLGDGMKYRIPTTAVDSTTIQPGEYLLLWADDQEDQGILHLDFKLSRDGGDVGLMHYTGNQYIDSLSYSKQYKNSSLSLCDELDWIAVPSTPGRANFDKTLSKILMNEFSASNDFLVEDQFGEYDDWIEFYNGNSVPVDLGGLFITDSLADGMKYRIPSTCPDSTTIPPNGYLLLWADNTPEQGVDHLDFKLSRQGGGIGLLQYNGADFLDSLTYAKQYKNSSSSLSSTQEWHPVPSTPGLENYQGIPAHIYINEFCASNETLSRDEFGESDDWIEIYNGNEYAIDIGGLFLTDSLAYGTKSRIPSTNPDSTTIPAKGFLLLWADNQEDQGILHLDFSLSRQGEGIGLISYDGRSGIDSISYGEQALDRSFSRYPDGSPSWIPMNATPGLSNIIEGVDKIYINEFKAGVSDNVAGDSWIELYNCNDYAVNVGGLYLTSNLAEPGMQKIRDDSPDSTIIAPMGYIIFCTSPGSFSASEQLDFNLSSTGGEIGLARLEEGEYAYLDSVIYSYQGLNVSTGRIKDGVNAWTDFTVPNPGLRNSSIISSVIQPENKSLHIYPNPVSGGRIYLSEIRNACVYNMQGILIQREEQVDRLDLHQLSGGLYILQTDKGETFRIILEQ